MALVTSTEMFKKAYAGGYAIGAFNVNNMEIVQGITEACGELKAPVILQVSKGARAYANHTYLVKLVEAAVIENPDITIVLHLDHGNGVGAGVSAVVFRTEVGLTGAGCGEGRERHCECHHGGNCESSHNLFLHSKTSCYVKMLQKCYKKDSTIKFRT